MMHDLFGLPTGIATTEGQRRWDAVQRAFLAHSASTPAHLSDLLRDEPGFALGHAAKGLFYLLLGRRELVETAAQVFETGWQAARARGTTPRERLYLDALGAWLAGFPVRAIHQLETVLDTHPEDALALKLSHAIRFVLGDAAGMRASIERVLPAYGPDHAAHGYVLGCHAFALEETGEYERAEIAGRKALWSAPDDAWGLHAVAHVHDMIGRARDGIEWLTGREAAWSHCNNFRYHVWWHKALMHLDQGEVDVVFDLYDREIRKERTDDYRDISNATSLLMRLELEGHDVGDRWEELAELSARRTEDGCLIFADLHYLLALTGDNRTHETARLVARIAEDARRTSTEGDLRMARPGLDAAEGVRQFSEGHYAEACRHLTRVSDSLHLAGGSHAQRDVFERIGIDAGLRAGLIDEAEALLNRRKKRRAGRDDTFSALRREIIAAARNDSGACSVPAE